MKRPGISCATHERPRKWKKRTYSERLYRREGAHLAGRPCSLPAAKTRQGPAVADAEQAKGHDESDTDDDVEVAR